MLFVVSPAKKLDFDSPQPHLIEPTQPLFVPQAQALIDVLKEKTPEEIGSLMDLSEALSHLNYDRYQVWTDHFDLNNSRPAVYAFNGDVYAKDGLEAESLNTEQVTRLQEHLIILSGLYGILRPMDLMQPYRLEMGSKLVTSHGKNLYEYWGSTLAEYINKRLAHHKNKVLVHLASSEYIKSVDRKALKYPMVECVFQEKRHDKYRVIVSNTKRARGAMVRLAIKNKIDTLDGIKQLEVNGHRFVPEISTEDKYVFRRD